MRTSEDQEAIKSAAAGAKSIAVVGSSWIATEVASALIGKYKDTKDVYLVQSTEFPLERCLGKEIGSMLAKDHTDAGVKILAKENVTAILGDSDGKVRGV